MKVENIMARTAVDCRPMTSLADAARLMFDGDFGFLPATENGKLVGVVTDRDICIGTATMPRPACRIPVTAVMSREPFTCRAEDELTDALATMATHRVRRLPVVDDAGRLQGVLSINDVIQELHGQGDVAEGPDVTEVVATLKSIGHHRDLPSQTTPDRGASVASA